MIPTKYMEMTSDKKTSKIRCRICQTDVYDAPTEPGIDSAKMEAALDHFDVGHQVSRVDILLDIEKAFHEKAGKKPS